ncbi:unnamed protein product [Urochloa humidicola]
MAADESVAAVVDRSLQEQQQQIRRRRCWWSRASDAWDFVRFDVYVNAREYRKVPLCGREMAGTFAALRHPGGKGMVVRTSMRVALNLNELLEDLGAEGDDNVTVT